MTLNLLQCLRAFSSLIFSLYCIYGFHSYSCVSSNFVLYCSVILNYFHHPLTSPAEKDLSYYSTFFFIMETCSLINKCSLHKKMKTNGYQHKLNNVLKEVGVYSELFSSR